MNEAVARYGRPEIFNTDQGSQFTSEEFTSVLLALEIKISMDGKGRCIDNNLARYLYRSPYLCLPSRCGRASLRDGLDWTRRRRDGVAESKSGCLNNSEWRKHQNLPPGRKASQTAEV